MLVMPTLQRRRPRLRDWSDWPVTWSLLVGGLGLTLGLPDTASLLSGWKTVCRSPWPTPVVVVGRPGSCLHGRPHCLGLHQGPWTRASGTSSGSLGQWLWASGCKTPCRGQVGRGSREMTTSPERLCVTAASPPGWPSSSAVDDLPCPKPTPAWPPVSPTSVQLAEWWSSAQHGWAGTGTGRGFQWPAGESPKAGNEISRFQTLPL